MGLKERIKEMTGFTRWFGEASSDSKLYFAYGSNMNRDQMNTRCPQARALAIAKFSEQRFLINSRGVATVVPEQGCSVYGIIWLLSHGDEASLDCYEGVKDEIYYKKIISVKVANDSIPTLTYIASDIVQGTPREGYLETIMEGAQSFNAHQGWFRELKSWSVCV